MASAGSSDSDYFRSAFNSTLINGKGRYPGGPSAPLAIVNVLHGLRSVFYLFSILGLF
jgi:iron transport multicopper oxidase